MSTGDMKTRVPALDGLRGLAALVVVATHVLLTNHAWATTWLAVPANAGRAAVMVFFVLSGYVLARPFTAGRGKSWRVYYPSRMVRLYLPVWGALAFAVILAALVPRVGGTGNWWVDFQAAPPSWPTLVGHSTLWAPGEFLNPLWSLKWEVAFSLLLPLYVAVARWATSHLPAAFTVLFLVHSGAWALGVESVAYLTVFGFGALLAVTPRMLLGARWWIAAAAAAAVALAADLLPVQVAGALLLVAAVLWCPSVAVWFSSAPLLWLGRVSFSLYLVHVPVILAVHAAAGGVVLVAGVPLSLVVAAVFYRLVEEPAQRLAGRVRPRAAEDQSEMRRSVSPETGSKLTAEPMLL